MTPLNLTLIRRLDALCIECLTKWIGVAGLQTVIGAEVDECTILVAKVLVHARGQQPLCRQIAYVRLELKGARRTASQRHRAIAAPTWANGAAWTRQNVCRAISSRSTFVEAEQAIVERNLGGIPLCGQVRQGSRLKLWTGDVHRRSRRQNDTQAFRVDKEEGPVFNDWPTKRRCPLIRVVEGSRCAGVVQKPVVRIHDTAVPEIH